MEYDKERKAFFCKKCSPFPWKYIYTQTLWNKETGDVFCIVHKEDKIGKLNMISNRSSNETRSIT